MDGSSHGIRDRRSSRLIRNETKGEWLAAKTQFLSGSLAQIDALGVRGSGPGAGTGPGLLGRFLSADGSRATSGCCPGVLNRFDTPASCDTDHPVTTW